MSKEINLLGLDMKLRSAQPLAFGKGIALAAGFDLGAGIPLDSRLTVDTIAERDGHVSGNRAYEGMFVFVKEDGKTYQLINGAWEEFGFNDEKFQAGIKPVVDKNNEQDQRLTTLEGLVVGGEGEGLASVVADVAKNKSDISTLQTDLVAERDRALAAESAIDMFAVGIEEALQVEIERATNAEIDLSTAITAEQQRVNGELAKKVDNTAFASEQERVNAALDSKIEAADLALKADKTEVNSALALKADKVQVATDIAAGVTEAKDHANQAVADLVNGAPEALDTLKELADALQANEGAYDALLEVVGGKADKASVEEVDATYKAAVSRLTSDIGTVDFDLEKEIVRAKSAEGNLRSDLSAAQRSIGENRDAISKEVSDRTSDISAVNSRVSKNKTTISDSEPTWGETGHVWLQIM